MDRDSLQQRLSRMSTLWSVLFQAHAGTLDAVAAAQQRLLERYRGAVYRYLLGAVRNPDVADELSQEFALRFVRGDFKNANPERGRFRDYLKTALRNLVGDHQRARQRWPQPLAADVPETAAAAEADADDFLTGWREELLERTWQALEQANPAYHAVLRQRIDNLEATSAELAQRLSVSLDRPVNAPWVRKTLQRAQEKFAELLIDEVEGSLGQATPEQLRQELEGLDLLRYCGSVLARRCGQG
jgi:RNA polymerase sigma-70 factor (ECF subfamily)